MAPFPSVMSDSTDIFSCVYLATKGIYTFCVESKSKEMLSMSVPRWQELFFFSRAGAIEVNWNWRRSYLVSSNFGFGFRLVLI